MRTSGLLVFILTCLFVMNASRSPQTSFNEKYRPQFHFTIDKNYLGNPAGFIFYEDEYHLFYQYNPNGKEAVKLHLGHAVSKDLVHWKNLPPAIKPVALPGDSVCSSILSGSIVVDHGNVLGLQQGSNKTLVLFYTGNQCGQLMSVSTDKGTTWKPYSGNPVIPYYNNDEACHPQVFWNASSGKWVMVLYRKTDNDNRRRGFSFYTSENLVKWDFQSHLAGMFENPVLMELRVNNRPGDTRWVIMESNGNYLIGSFDGKSFIAESIRLKGDFGPNFRAAQTADNIPAADGRTLQIAGLKDGEWPDMPFSGQFSFPCELSLKKVSTGTYLCRQPAREIETLYGKEHVWKNENLIPGLNKNLIKKIQGECFRIKGRFDIKNCDAFGIMLRVGKKSPGTELMYNVKRNALTLQGATMGLAPIDNKITLDILIDRASVEVYANGGIACLSSLLFAPENDKDFVLFNTGGELLVEELTINEISPVWTIQK
jgi:fructan beta-fructosidase